MIKFSMSHKKLPIVPLRDIVLFSGSIVPLFIGREKSINALSSIKDGANGQRILFVAQKSHDEENPAAKDLFSIGVEAIILQTIRLPNNTIKLLVECENRVKITKIIDGQFLEGEFQRIYDEDYAETNEVSSMINEALDLFKKYAKVNKKINPEVVSSIVSQQGNPAYLSNIIACHLTCKVAQRQELLEITSVPKRLEHLINTISAEIAVIDADASISNRVRKQVEKTQKDYYLNEQMKAIQKELGEDDKSEMLDIENKIKELPMNEDAKNKAESELKKLKSMNPMASEASVVRSYLDTLVSMPWGKYDKSRVDIKKAAEILDRDHYGLEKVKERVIEYLSVLQLSLIHI